MTQLITSGHVLKKLHILLQKYLPIFISVLFMIAKKKNRLETIKMWMDNENIQIRVLSAKKKNEDMKFQING